MSNVLNAEAKKVQTVKDVAIETKKAQNPFTEFSTKVTKVVTQSQLTVLKTSINKEVEGNVKSVSAYFTEFRKNFENIRAYIKEAHTKGRTFDADLIHEILMVGNIKPLLAASDKIEAAKVEKLGSKYKAPTSWSANRMFMCFVVATETTTKK